MLVCCCVLAGCDKCPGISFCSIGIIRADEGDRFIVICETNVPSCSLESSLCFLNVWSSSSGDDAWCFPTICLPGVLADSLRGWK